MELRQFEYFIAVVDEGGFTAAAHRECVAQPAVSAQIQRLERQVGQPLLHRSRRGVTLTEAGRALLPHARAALAAVKAARDAVDEVTDLVRGTLAIGTVTSHELDVAGLLADFHDDFPDVEISLCTDNSASLIDKLGTGALDAAIISIGVDERPVGLDVAVVTDQALTAAVATDHPLASRATLSLAALCDHALISLPRGTGLRRTLDDACGPAGLEPRIVFEAGNPLALADLARRGLGVAVLPEGFARTRSDLHALRIIPELRGRLVWAWRTVPSPATRKFAERALHQLNSAR